MTTQQDNFYEELMALIDEPNSITYELVDTDGTVYYFGPASQVQKAKEDKPVIITGNTVREVKTKLLRYLDNYTTGDYHKVIESAVNRIKELDETIDEIQLITQIIKYFNK